MQSCCADHSAAARLPLLSLNPERRRCFAATREVDPRGQPTYVPASNGYSAEVRNTWTTYEVSLRTGKIRWQLGGKASSFTLTAAKGQVLNSAGDIFAWQHDPEAHGDGSYTFFDNEAAGAANTSTGVIAELSHSRAITVRLNLRTHVATLLSSDNQPEGLLAPSQGNTEVVGGGDVFVGWGSLPYLSEFSPSGKLIFNATFPAGVNSYRAYRLPWHPGAR